MKLPFAYLTLGAGVFLLWIAFHDITNLLNGETPTVSNVFNLVTTHITNPSASTSTTNPGAGSVGGGGDF